VLTQTCLSRKGGLDPSDMGARALSAHNAASFPKEFISVWVCAISLDRLRLVLMKTALGSAAVVMVACLSWGVALACAGRSRGRDNA